MSTDVMRECRKVRPMTRPSCPPRGFTLIELMVVVAVIAILALMAVPTYRDRIVRQQVADAIDSLQFAREGVAVAYRVVGEFPSDNTAAGLPPADKIVGAYVSSVVVRNGALELHFGNSADKVLKGRHLVLRPAYVAGYPQVPLAWICAAGKVPDQMTVQGNDSSDVPRTYLPLRCHPGGAAKS